MRTPELIRGSLHNYEKPEKFRMDNWPKFMGKLAQESSGMNEIQVRSKKIRVGMSRNSISGFVLNQLFGIEIS